MSTAVLTERRAPTSSGTHYTPSPRVAFELARCRTAAERVAVVLNDGGSVLTSLAERRLRDRSLAGDAVQEGYAGALMKLSEIAEERPVETLGAEDLFRLLAAHTDKWVRTNNRSGRAASREREALANAGDGAAMLSIADERLDDPLERVEHDRMWREWGELLPERHRQVFALDRSGFGRREVAEQLSVSEKVVKKTLEDISRRACDFEHEVFEGAICEEFREYLHLHLAGTLEESLGKRKASRARIHFSHCTTCRLRMRRAERGLATVFPVTLTGVAATAVLVAGAGKGFLAQLWGKLAVLNPFATGAGASGAAGVGGGAGLTGVGVAGGVGAKVVAVAAVGSLFVGGGVAIVQKATEKPAAPAVARTAASAATPASLTTPAPATPAAKAKVKKAAAKPKPKVKKAAPAKKAVATSPSPPPAPAPTPAPAPAPPPGPVVGSPDPGLSGP